MRAAMIAGSIGALILIAVIVSSMWLPDSGETLPRVGEAGRSETFPPARGAESRSPRSTVPARQSEISGPRTDGDLSVVVVVQDLDGNPVESARVSTSISNQSGFTDAAGRFIVDWKGRAGRITARARDGRMGSIAFAEPPVVGEVVITLQGASIRGWVRNLAGVLPTTPVRVAAWPSDGSEPQNLEDRLSQCFSNTHAELDQTIRVTVVDDTGSFSIDPVDPSRPYDLFVAASGYCLERGAERAGRDVIAGSEAVGLVIAPLYVLNLQLVESGGNPVETSPLLWSGSGRPFVRFEGAEPISATDRSHFLLEGTEWKRSRVEQTSARILQLYTSFEDAEELGPIEMRLALPGYEPRQASVVAARAWGADPRLQIVEMTPIADGFGEVEILLETPSVLPFEEASPAGSIHLLPKGWTLPDGSPRIELLPGVGRRLAVGGIPAGRYSVSINEYGAIAVPPISPNPIDVLADQRSVVRIDLGPLGGARFEAFTRRGEPYEGRLHLLLVRERVPVGPTFVAVPFRFDFEQAPYRLNTLPPGSYRFVGSRDRSRVNQPGNDLDSFDITDGIVTAVTVLVE